MVLSEGKRNHLYCATLDVWLASLAVTRKYIQKRICVGKENALSKSESLNYSLKISKQIETPKNSQTLNLNVAYFRDKLYLLSNLFFQNTIPFKLLFFYLAWATCSHRLCIVFFVSRYPWVWHVLTWRMSPFMPHIRWGQEEWRWRQGLMSWHQAARKLHLPSSQQNPWLLRLDF